MGFDVVYLPPIHPIGEVNRKGPNNTLTPGPDDPGSPVGDRRPRTAATTPSTPTSARSTTSTPSSRTPSELGLEVALDLALQCAPDHPWVDEHPEWFTTRADGIDRLRREPAEEVPGHLPGQLRQRPRRHLPPRCCGIVRLLDGPRRADLPRRQPAHQAGGLLGVAAARGPRDRPRRALPGRGVHPAGDDAARSARSASTSPTPTSPGATAKWEIEDYLPELSHETDHVMRPNFFVNTPDILHAYLQYGGPAAFKIRAVLAATAARRPGASTPATSCSSTSRCGRAARSTSTRRSTSSGSATGTAAEAEGRTLAPYLTPAQRDPPRAPRAAAAAQPDHPLRRRRERAGVLSKRRPTASDIVIVVVNLDPHGARETTVHLDMPALGLDWHDTFVVHDEITGRPGTGASTTTCASTRPRARPHPEREEARSTRQRWRGEAWTRRADLATIPSDADSRPRGGHRGRPSTEPQATPTGSRPRSSTRCWCGPSTTPTATAPATSAG